jgi:hypothetical protein
MEFLEAVVAAYVRKGPSFAFWTYVLARVEAVIFEGGAPFSAYYLYGGVLRLVRSSSNFPYILFNGAVDPWGTHERTIFGGRSLIESMPCHCERMLLFLNSRSRQ